MKYLLISIFCFLSVFGYTQSTLPLRADTVLIEKSGGSGELKIKNSTRDSLGVLVNIGGGKTRFMRVRAINDSAFIIPPNDTIVIRGGVSTGGGGSGTVNAGTQYQLGYYATNGTAISGLTLITASRALVSDANGLPVASTTTDTEIGYVNGVTSSIQTQLNSKANQTALVDTAAAIRADFPSGGGSVITDASLLGDGTALDPLKIDSGLLANHLGYDSLSLDTLGVIYNKTSWALLGEFFTAVGGVSASVVSNKVNIASSGANDFNRYLLTEYKSKIEHYRLQTDIIINNIISSTTYGIGIGKVSNPIGWVDLTNGVNAGKIYLQSASTQLAVSGSAISFSNLDTISLELRLSIDTIYFTVRNKTTGGTAVTISYAYGLTYAQAVEPALAGPFAIFEKGGAYIVNNMTLTSAEPINIPVLWLGTSKALGQYAGSYAARSSQLMNNRYTRTTNYGLSGGQLTDFLQFLPEIRSLRAKEIVIVDGGSNDKRAGIAGGVWRANYRKFVDSLTDMGAKVYHAPVWENSVDLSDIVTFIDSTYPGKRFLTYEAMLACGTACLVADNVHPNARGNDTLATVVIRDGRLLRNNYRINIRYVDGRGMGNNQSPSATLVVNKNGQFLNSTASIMGLYQQGGNSFGATATIGTNDNNNINFLRNGFPLIRFNDYPNHLLFHDKTGDEVVRIRADSVNNIAYGKGSHASMTTGGAGNTSVGANAGLSSTTATNNTDVGFEAGRSRVIGQRNTNVGMSANYYSTGSQNVVIGSFAGSGAPTATYAGSVFVGDGAGYGTTSGADNIAIGRASGANVTTGSNNTAIGVSIDFPSATASNQLVIKNGIFGTGLSGTGTTIPAGKIGIMNNAPAVTFHITGTDAIAIPVGTTAQRPTGAAGYLRANSDSSNFPEFYDGSNWRGLATKKFVTDLGINGLTTNYIGVGASNLLSGSSAYQYNGTSVLQENSGAISAITSTTAVGSTSGGVLNLYAKDLPTAANQVLGTINFGSRNGTTADNVGIRLRASTNGAWTDGSAEQAYFTIESNATGTLNEIMRITANGRVGIGAVSNPGARVQIAAGFAAAGGAPFMYTSGTNLTTPVAGAEEYDGTSRFFTPGSTRLRYTLTDNSIPANGQLAIGNGVNYTNATPASSDGSVTITTGAGSLDFKVAGASAFPVATYTPTLTNTSNITGSTAYSTYYQRIGNRVYVWGKLDLDPVAATTETEIGIELPVPSSFANDMSLSGTGACGGNNSTAGIEADVSNSRAKLIMNPTVDGSFTVRFHFSYYYTAP